MNITKDTKETLLWGGLILLGFIIGFIVAFLSISVTVNYLVNFEEPEIESFGWTISCNDTFEDIRDDIVFNINSSKGNTSWYCGLEGCIDNYPSDNETSKFQNGGFEE